MADAVIRIRLDDSELRSREIGRQRSAARQVGERLGLDEIKFDEGRDYVAQLESMQANENRKAALARMAGTATGSIGRGAVLSDSLRGGIGAIAKYDMARRLHGAAGGGWRGNAALAALSAASNAPGLIAGASGLATGATGIGGAAPGFSEGLSNFVAGVKSNAAGVAQGGMMAAQLAEQLAELGITPTAGQAVNLGRQSARVARAYARGQQEDAEARAGAIGQTVGAAGASSANFALMVGAALGEIPTEQLSAILEPVIRTMLGRG